MSESTLISRLSFSPGIAAKLTDLNTEVLHQLRNSATILNAIDSIDKSTSSLYYELLVHTAAVEQTGFAVDCGTKSSCSGQALHVLRSLDRIKLHIDALRCKLYSQNGGSVLNVDHGGSLSLSQLRRKIDDLQAKFESALSLISEHRRRLPLSYHVALGSGGRSLRFVDDDDDEGDEGDHENKDGDRCLLHRLTLSCSSDHLVNAGQCPRWSLGVLDESTICASENGSPIASPPSASRRPRFFPSSLSSRENFRATQRRKAWKTIARSVDAEMSRPCLSLPLFSSEQYSETLSGGHDVSYALHRRRFRAVKAVDWVETLRPHTIATASAHDSLADDTLVGDLSELLAKSLSVRPTAPSASSSTLRPDEGSAVAPPASTLMATFTTSALPALLESHLRYSYKVKPPPPPPPPPPAALSAPDAPPSAPAPVANAKAILPASVHSGAAAAAPAKEPSVEEEIRRIFAQHNPSKISDVPELLQKYAGKEALLLEKMRKKYEQAPPKPATACAPTTLGSVAVPPATTASTGATAGRPATSASFSVSNVFGGAGNAAPVSFSGGAAAPTPFSGGAVTSVFTPPKANAPTGSATFSGSLGSGAPKSLFGGAAGSLQSPPPAATPSQSQFGNGFGVSGAGTGGAEGIQRRIEAIYRQHNPQKMAEIPQLMQKYAGKEQELLDRVQKKYVSQPAAAVPSAPSTSLFRSSGAAQGATQPPSFGAGFGSPSVLGGGSAAGGTPGTGLATSLFRK